MNWIGTLIFVIGAVLVSCSMNYPMDYSSLLMVIGITLMIYGVLIKYD